MVADPCTTRALGRVLACLALAGCSSVDHARSEVVSGDAREVAGELGVKASASLALDAFAMPTAGDAKAPGDQAPAVDARDALPGAPAVDARGALPAEPAARGSAGRARASPPSAGETVRIEAGEVRVGSLPGTPLRTPMFEADGVSTRLGAFEIDRLPFPNDPARAPVVSVTRDEAAALCAVQGKRLCTELEWERACAGPLGAAGDIYPGGATFDAETCSLDPLACASPEGVLALGTAAAEWTSSAAAQELAATGDTIVRGAVATAPAGQHRCASRRAFPATTRLEGLGFRCCRGEARATAYPAVERYRTPFVDRAMDRDAQRAVLAAMPEVARFAPDFRPFGPEEVDRALGRGGRTREALGGWALMAGVLEWWPEQGERVWVLAGTSGDDAVLVAAYPMPDGSYRHAASFVLEGERVPIAVAWGLTSQRELLWSSCWGCGGEGGALTFKDDATLVITQR
jgi:formylglycine-generating enzyme required for sulfatase activity